MSSLLEDIRQARAGYPELWKLCASITRRCEGKVVLQPNDVVDLTSGSIVLRGERLVQLAPRRNGEDRPKLVHDVGLRLLQKRDDVQDGDREIRATHNGEVDVHLPQSHLVLWVKDPSSSYDEYNPRSWKEGARISIARADRIDAAYLETLQWEKHWSRAHVSCTYLANAQIGVFASGAIIAFPQNGKLQLREDPGQLTFRWWMPDESVSDSVNLTRQPPDVVMHVLEAFAASGPHSTRAALHTFFNALFFLSDPQTLIALPPELHGTEKLMEILKIPLSTTSSFFKKEQLEWQYPQAYAFFARLAKDVWSKQNTEKCATEMIASLSEDARWEICTVLAVPSLRGICEVALRVLISYRHPGLVAVHRETNLVGHRAFVSAAGV